MYVGRVAMVIGFLPASEDCTSAGPRSLAYASRHMGLKQRRSHELPARMNLNPQGI